MRPNLTLRLARPVHLGIAAAILAIPAGAVALSAGQADAQSAIQITLTPHRATVGARLAITGNATIALAGQRLQLQFAPAGSATWQTLGSTTAHGDGAYRFTVPARRSGRMRVVPAGEPAVTDAARSPVAPARSLPATGGASSLSASAEQPITVAARFAVPRRSLTILAGRRGHLSGKLLPALAGRRVRLLTRTQGGWRTLASARTGPRGGFDLPVPDTGSGQRWLRVAFGGDRANGPALAKAGSVTVLAPSVASWYDDAGATACGFHAYFGVANRTLPCGTRVTISYGARSVTAVVDDRGPYVGGRDWDLNQNIAGVLGFGGVDTVWSSL
jgi:rare lipoprotein A